jgi:alkaline phosphatase
MKRRDFFRNTSLAVVGSTIAAPVRTLASVSRSSAAQAKNIIFLVSDGMSTGTLNMANMLLQRKEGRASEWVRLYEAGLVKRALMDTASASSLVTDSAAASSSWGGGVRVNNGSLNVGPNGEEYKPILQKFKAAGKSVGCVTTVPITHATPAGFCVNSKSRGDQSDIAVQYLDLHFDVMMGGGAEFFDKDKRKDKADVFGQFAQKGYTVVRDRDAMLALKSGAKKPVLGVFHEDGLPYTLDAMQDTAITKAVPTLAEMTKAAIQYMSTNSKGFVLQVEGGKVDWAAHANDGAALLYDQIAFDEAIKVAVEFAEKDKNTLVIITTDHGNANPGLFSGSKANANFDRIQTYKHTNDWILRGITKDFSAAQIIERIEAAQGYAITQEEAAQLLTHYAKTEGDGLYNPYKLPFKELALIQQRYNSIGWGSMDHSADYVELAMLGPGSELLKQFVKNTDLHYLMLEAAGMEVERKQLTHR